jgi:hypothetical protein
MARQYVACKFKTADARTYTYHNDGDPVAVGDEVRMPDGRGSGWKRVTVWEIFTIAPKFATKAILARVEEPKPAATLV